MADLKKHLQIIRALHKRDLTQYDNLSMLMDMVLAVKDEDIELAKDEAQFVKRKAAIGTRGKSNVKQFADLYWKAMLFLAQNRDLDSYLIYLEKDRDPEETH